MCQRNAHPLKPAIRAALHLACLLSGVLSIPAQSPPTSGRDLIHVPAPVGDGGKVEDIYAGSHALIVGVARYDHAGVWASLETVPSELAELAAALRASGFQTVELLLDPTGVEIRRGVEDFIGRHGFVPGNRLLLFFSGHGYTLDDGERGYFVTRDAPDPRSAEAGFRATALSMQQIATWALEIVAKHAMFAFDSCFAGSIFRTRDNQRPASLSSRIARPVRQFLTAGGAGERVPARSVFTPTFIRGLRGDADLDSDGFITGTELGNFVQREVIAYKTNQTPEFGKIRDPRLDEGDVVFVVPRQRPGQLSSIPSRGSENVKLDTTPPPKAAGLSLADECERAGPRGCAELAQAHDRGSGAVRDVSRALRLYELSCRAGHLPACVSRARMYQIGRGTRVDAPQAAALFQQACDQRDADGCWELGRVYERGLGVRMNPARADAAYRGAIEIYRDRCDQRDTSACDELGSRLFAQTVGADAALTDRVLQAACDGGHASACTRLAITRRLADVTITRGREVIELFEKACDHNDATACERLARAIASGYAGLQDAERSLALYEKARTLWTSQCDRNELAACRSLASMYRSGRGVQRDAAKVEQIFSGVIEQLSSLCDRDGVTWCVSLGQQFENGEGVKADATRAAELYRRSCNGGDPFGCYLLGRLHHAGNGVPRDLERATELYNESCRRGVASGCHDLARVFESRGGSAFTTAAALYDQACRWGNPFACVQLARLYRNGDRVPRDPDRAVALYQSNCRWSSVACVSLAVLYEHGMFVTRNRNAALEFFRYACEMGNREGCFAVERLQSTVNQPG